MFFLFSFFSLSKFYLSAFELPVHGSSVFFTIGTNEVMVEIDPFSSVIGIIRIRELRLLEDILAHKYQPERLGHILEQHCNYNGNIHLRLHSFPLIPPIAVLASDHTLFEGPVPFCLLMFLLQSLHLIVVGLPEK